MGLLDIDNVINNEQPLFKVAIIKLIKSKKTDMICWLDWKVNDGFYKYNVFSKQLESTLYDFDPRHWFVYQLWGSPDLFICKYELTADQRLNAKVTPVHLYGTYNAISLERVLELMNE